MSDIVEETFYRFSSSAKQQHKTFELELGGGEAYAQVDREAFTKILSNLLNNALKYSETMIRVELTMLDNAFRVTVTNDGEVVPPEMREAIFAPFFRHTRKSESTGTGIGLALSRSLAERTTARWSWAATRELNEFILTIPVCRQEAADAGDPASEENPESIPDERGDPGWEAYSILVVEDNPEMCAFIRRQVSENYSVLTAENGVEALELLEKNFINLIVSDIMMPKMDGIELCRRVKTTCVTAIFP